MTAELNDNTIIVMTGAQLREFAGYILNREDSAPKEERSSERRWVYGLHGICDLFGGISRVTAQKWKDTWLAPAIIQRGRKIMTDAEKALDLFNENFPGRQLPYSTHPERPGK